MIVNDIFYKSPIPLLTEWLPNFLTTLRARNPTGNPGWVSGLMLLLASFGIYYC